LLRWWRRRRHATFADLHDVRVLRALGVHVVCGRFCCFK
jgi:hypothetical protein